jgi:Protein of unknown function (DUF3800)
MQQSDDPLKQGVVLTCYCDDSGSDEQSKVAVVGGLVMHKEQFVGLHQRWEGLLKEFKIDKVHMRDFVRPYGRYSAMAPEMKIALFSSVARIINESKIYSVSAGIPQTDYKAALSMEVYRKLMGPYALAFLVVVSINKMVSTATGYLHRTAYLIDKGNDNHHEQLQGAHTALLILEKNQNEFSTGAMASDLDDHNFALQAADVIAWTYHRTLESQDVGAEFQPLLAVLERQVKISPTKSKVHLSMSVPSSAVTSFADLVKGWIASEGRMPSWKEMIASHVAAQGIEGI